MKHTFKDKLITEAIDFFKIDSLLNFDDEEQDLEFEDFDDEEQDLEFEDFDENAGDLDSSTDDDSEEFLSNDDSEDSHGEERNPNKEGLIRSVKGAYLVYKRVTANNNYEELWVYNLGNVKYQTKIRNAILSGTDIDPINLRSPDNEQTASIWSKGNIQFLHVDGLPN